MEDGLLSKFHLELLNSFSGTHTFLNTSTTRKVWNAHRETRVFKFHENRDVSLEQQAPA